MRYSTGRWVSGDDFFNRAGAQSAGSRRQPHAAFEDVLAASTTKDSHVSQEDVAYALLSKGIAYGQLGETASAIQCFEALVGRFVESDDEIFQELAAQAFFGKGVAYGQLGETAQALVSFEEIMTRFGTSDNPRLRVFVAKALVGKSTEQLKEGRPDDAMSTCNELAAKFGALVDSNAFPSPGMRIGHGRRLWPPKAAPQAPWKRSGRWSPGLTLAAGRWYGQC